MLLPILTLLTLIGRNVNDTVTDRRKMVAGLTNDWNSGSHLLPVNLEREKKPGLREITKHDTRTGFTNLLLVRTPFGMKDKRETSRRHSQEARVSTTIPNMTVLYLRWRDTFSNRSLISSNSFSNQTENHVRTKIEADRTEPDFKNRQPELFGKIREVLKSPNSRPFLVQNSSNSSEIIGNKTYRERGLLLWYANSNSNLSGKHLDEFSETYNKTKQNGRRTRQTLIANSGARAVEIVATGPEAPRSGVARTSEGFEQFSSSPSFRLSEYAAVIRSELISTDGFVSEPSLRYLERKSPGGGKRIQKRFLVVNEANGSTAVTGPSMAGPLAASNHATKSLSSTVRPKNNAAVFFVMIIAIFVAIMICAVIGCGYIGITMYRGCRTYCCPAKPADIVPTTEQTPLRPLPLRHDQPAEPNLRDRQPLRHAQPAEPTPRAGHPLAGAAQPSPAR